MCGIIGYIGKTDGRKFVLDGLKKLDYRGYDSWGIAGINEKGLWHHKALGVVDIEKVGESSNIVIGHTRWCTHGKVSKANAHPHLSNNGEIAVVHNGIIDNYLELKKMLEEKGYKFLSETDTEIISNLISYYMKDKEFIEAFGETIKQLKGTYAIAAINETKTPFKKEGIPKHKQAKIAFARQNSPLVIGVSEGELFISSDSAPFLEKTKKAVFLNDGEWGYFYGGDMFIFDKKEKPVDIKIEEIEWENNEQKKEGYEHYMLKEIYEQSETITNAAKQINLDLAKNEIRNSQEVFLVACGTSYNACLAASSFFAKNKIKTTPILASEYQTHEPFFSQEKKMIVVSQSGETADLIEVVDKAKLHGVKIIGIINVPGSTLWRKADIVMPMNAGIEIGVASTKAYIATLTIFSLLAENHFDIENTSTYLKEEIKKWHEKVKEIKEKIKRDLFIIGKNEALSYAMETALKVKEISYIRAEGLASGELKHGTLALIEEGIPVISIATPETKQDLLNNVMEIKARGGYMIGIDCENHPCYDYFIECKYPILSVIPGQLLAYELSISKGYNPDKPRNLAKSVTVK